MPRSRCKSNNLSTLSWPKGVLDSGSGFLKWNENKYLIFSKLLWTSLLYICLLSCVLNNNIVVADELVPNDYVEVPCCTHHFRHHKGILFLIVFMINLVLSMHYVVFCLL